MEHHVSTLRLKTTLRLHDTPEVRVLTDLLVTEFPDGRYKMATVASTYRLEIDLETSVSEQRSVLLLDLLRTLDAHLVETVFIRGQLGDDLLAGYLGPEKHEKEKSRDRLNEIRAHLRHLLPEHRNALRYILADG